MIEFTLEISNWNFGNQLTKITKRMHWKCIQL